MVTEPVQESLSSVSLEGENTGETLTRGLESVEGCERAGAEESGRVCLFGRLSC